MEDVDVLFNENSFLDEDEDLSGEFEEEINGDGRHKIFEEIEFPLENNVPDELIDHDDGDDGDASEEKPVFGQFIGFELPRKFVGPKYRDSSGLGFDCLLDSLDEDLLRKLNPDVDFLQFTSTISSLSFVANSSGKIQLVGGERPSLVKMRGLSKKQESNYFQIARAHFLVNWGNIEIIIMTIKITIFNDYQYFSNSTP